MERYSISFAARWGGLEFRNCYGKFGLPGLDKLQPEFVMISAGFDAHRSDPLAARNFDAADVAGSSELCGGQ